MFVLLAPVLLLAIGFGIDATAAYRDSLHLQRLADRAALSAAPLLTGRDRAAPHAVAAALVAADDGGVWLDYAGPTPGDGIEVIVSSDRSHPIAALVPGGPRNWARAVAKPGPRGAQLVE